MDDRRDILREIYELHGETVVDPPYTCNRCGRIFEGAIRDAESGRSLSILHVQGGPNCHPRGGAVIDRRLRRG